MTLTLLEIARQVNGALHGSGDLLIAGAATIRDAQPGQLTLADGDKALKQLATSQAAAALVGRLSTPPNIPFIQVDDPRLAFAQVVEHFRPRRAELRSGISPAARVSAQARLAADVVVHAGATIAEDVEIAAGCTIYSGVVIEPGCRLGAGTTIYPNVVLYENTLIGAQCIVHAGAVLGAFGFGYTVVNGRHQPTAQLGYVHLEDHVEVGAGTTIDRGSYGATTIGAGTKIDNQVQIAHNVRIGRHNLICAQAGIAGSATTGDYVVIAGQVGIRDHTTIGAGVQLGAKCGVMSDLPIAGMYVGAPATPEREYFQSLFGFAKLPEMRKQMKQLQRDVDQLKGSGPSLARPEAA